MANSPTDTIRTRKVAFLVAEGVDADSVDTVKEALEAEGAVVELVAPRLGNLFAEDDTPFMIKKSFLTASSVFYDAVYIPAGTNSVATIAAEPEALHFINQAYKHCKAIAADAAARQVLEAAYFGKNLPDDADKETVLQEGIVIAKPDVVAERFVDAIAQHRFWERETPRQVPA
jgi:catalase